MTESEPASLPEAPWGSASTFLPDVYDELRRLAGRALAEGAPTLQPTALVHEAFLKCQGEHRFRDRTHFKAVAAAAIRQILIDHARRRQAARHGRGMHRTYCELADLPGTTVDLVVLDDLLTTLARLGPRKARVVELRVFGGMTIDETALALEVSHMTITKEWRFARAWLAAEMGASANNGASPD